MQTDDLLFHAGSSTKAEKPLRLKDLERFKDQRHLDSVHELKKALATLLPHLRDELVEVDRVSACEPGSSWMTVFRHPILENEGCYVFVSRKGRVVTGRADPLKPTSDLMLGQFNSSRDEILSVTTTRQGRFFGHTVDLFVVVRCLESSDGGSEPQIYHALISFDDNLNPQLKLSLDDSLAVGQSWDPIPAVDDRFPILLKKSRIHLSYEVDPFSPDFQSSSAILQELPQEGRTALALSSQGCVGMYSGGLFRAINAQGEKPRGGWGEEISFLTLVDQEQGDPRSTLGVAGFESHRLIAFDFQSVSEDQNGWSWRHHLADFPSCAAFLPRSAEELQTDLGSWPEILLAFRSGELARFRYVGREAIYSLWNELWERLDQKEGDTRLRRARLEISKDSREWGRALLFVAVTDALERVLDAPDEEDLVELQKAVVSLFRPNRDYRILSSPLQPLFQALRHEVEKEEPRTVVSRFILSVLAEIYRVQGKANIEILNQIDRVIGSLDNETWSSLPRNPDIEELRVLSRRNRQMIRVERAQQSEWTDEERVERAARALERWASAFLPADAVHLGRWKGPLTLYGAAGFRSQGNSNGKSLVAVATQRGISIHALNRFDQLNLDPVATFCEEEGHHQVLAIPHQPGQVLSLDSKGKLTLLQWDQGRSDLEVVSSASIKNVGAPGAWALVPVSQDGSIGVVTCRNGHRCEWAFFSIDQNRIRLINRYLAEIPGVSCVDLAVVGENGLLLIAGSSLGGPVQVYQVSWTKPLSASESGSSGDNFLFEDFKKKESYWPSTGGTSSVCFTQLKDPEHIVIGDLGGFLWCGRLVEDVSGNRLAWVYQLDAGIRSILPMEIDGEIYVLAGSDAGKLALLQCSDALRVWTYRLQFPVVDLALASNDRQMVLAILREGWLYTLEKSESRQSALAEFEEVLGQLGRLEFDRLPNVPTAEIATSILELRSNEAAKEIFSKLERREHKARFLRYFAEVKSTEEELSKLEDFLSELTCREIQLLLCYMPVELKRLEQPIQEELQKRVSPGLAADDSRMAAYTAWVSFLHRLERQHAPLGELVEMVPRDSTWYSSTWISLECARVFLKAAAKKGLSRLGVSKISQESLFSFALPHILRFPPRFLESCSDVLPHNDGNKPCCFRDLWRIVRDLEDGKEPPQEEMSRLALLLAGDEISTSRMVALVRELFTLFGYGSGTLDEDEESWQESRSEVLETLGALIEVIRRIPPKEIEDLGGAVIQRLREFLPPIPFPSETAPQEERERWLKSALEALLDEGTGFELGIGSAWEPVIRSAVKNFQKIFRTIVDCELKFLLHETRPFLKLARRPDVLAGHEVWLQIEMRPEGRRLLDYASVLIDASGEGGFLDAPESVARIHRHYAKFRPGDDPEVFELRGFVPREARTLRVSVELEAAGYRHFQDWYFEIPTISEVAGEQQTQPLAFVKDHVLEELRGIEDAVVLLVLDQALGRDSLIQEWRQSTGGRQVDLDAEFLRFGKDRLYAERPIDFDFLQEIVSLKNDSDRPVLLGPTDQTLARWFGGEAPGTLESLVKRLRERQNKKDSPQMVWVVSSTHAAKLRPLGIESIRAIWAYRPTIEGLDYNTHELQRTDFWKSLIDDGAQSAFGNGSQASRDGVWLVYQSLGGDLFFIALWLIWIVERPLGSWTNMKDFFQEKAVRQRLEAEFGSLGGLDLLVALAGAHAITLVRLDDLTPGLVTEELYSSTTAKRAPKILIQRGQAFDPQRIQSLKSDSSPPAQVKIQGYGLLRGTVDSEERRTLLTKLIKRRSKQKLIQSFERLARYGVGTWKDGVFRTTDPYRSMIRAVYNQLLETPIEERDEAAYRKILGEGRSPLESVSFLEMTTVPDGEMEVLIPGANKEERKALRGLANLWREDDSELRSLLPIYKILFGRQREVWIPQSGEKRWDRSILALEAKCVGVGISIDEGPGKKFPVGYHLWLSKNSDLIPAAITRAIESATERRRFEWADRKRPSGQGSPESSYSPRVVVTGPGSEKLSPDRERRFAVLRPIDFLQAAWEGNMASSLLRRAHAQMRLVTISPFQTSGPIPPGSKCFFGRQEEREFIESRLSKKSFLIIGSRRVGKTSLLNQIRFQAAADPHLEPIYVDLQGQKSIDQFERSVRSYFQALESKDPLWDFWKENEPFSAMVKRLRRTTGRFPVFLFNEIDGLATHAVQALESWRAVQEVGDGTFVMTAYVTVNHLGDPRSPLFNWTVGPEYNGQAMVLTQLTPEAAEDLIGMLESEELGLAWRSETIKKKALKLILERSYRIPWVLQAFGQRLVERMESQRRGVLDFADVEHVLAGEGDIVWRYFNDIDYSSLGPGLGQRALRPGFQLVLYCLVRYRYFDRRDPIIRDRYFRYRSPLDVELGFTVAEARLIVKDTLKELLSEERTVVENWFDKLDLEKALPLLTLTLMLVADPKQMGRFGFLMHILPRELLRKYGVQDPYLDNLVVETAVEFWSLIQ